jgi:hypothetical protein
MELLALKLNCTLPSGLLRVVAELRTPEEFMVKEPLCPRTEVLMVLAVAGGDGAGGVRTGGVASGGVGAGGAGGGDGGGEAAPVLRFRFVTAPELRV